MVKQITTIVKKSLATFFLFIFFSTKVFTDEIQDFQIAGLNVKDSLLNSFDRKSIELELNSSYTFIYKNNTFAAITAGNTDAFDLRISSDTYDDIGITIKPNDRNYKIYALSGRIFCPEDINYCKSKKKEIEGQLLNFFGKNVKITRSEKNHAYDKTGESKTYNTYFQFKSGDYVSISTIDWSPRATNKDGVPFPDNTKVGITTAEFEKFLAEIQYKE